METSAQRLENFSGRSVLEQKHQGASIERTVGAEYQAGRIISIGAAVEGEDYFVLPGRSDSKDGAAIAARPSVSSRAVEIAVRSRHHAGDRIPVGAVRLGAEPVDYSKARSILVHSEQDPIPRRAIDAAIYGRTVEFAVRAFNKLTGVVAVRIRPICSCAECMQQRKLPASCNRKYRSPIV